MFRWMRRRERFENLKLIQQNLLSLEYLGKFLADAVEFGTASDEDARFLSEMRLIYRDVLDLQRALKLREKLTPEEFKAAFELNKSLRIFYDQVQSGKKRSAQRFGLVSDKLEPFDRKFEPDEGWEIYAEKFDE